MSFQPLPDPPTPVVVPEMVPRGTVKTIFNPAADNFAQSLNPFSLYLQDFRAWVQNANQIMYANVDGIYGATVVARDAAAGSASAANTSAQNAATSESNAGQSAIAAYEQADRSELFAGDSQSASTNALNTVSSIAPKLGLNIGNWKIEDGELIVAHLSTATPTIVQGDFILTYEEIEDFA